MTDRRVFLIGGISTAGLVLTGCEKLKKTVEDTAILLNQNKGNKRWPNYRYRLTVEVDTPEGVKSGSSVIEVETAMSGPNNISSPGSLYLRARGEAVTVDLGERGLLFALLRSRYIIDWAAGALMSVVPRLSSDEIRNLPEGVGEFDILMKRLLAVPYELPRQLPRYVQLGVNPPALSGPPSGYPMLVRFDDLTKPETVKRVEPDDIAASFGDGIALKSITVARTEEMVTASIKRRLNWVNQNFDKMLDGSRINNSQELANILSVADFKRD